MDILNLLENIEDIIEDASKIPLSNKVMVDKEEILEILSEIRMSLPDEISRASWVAKEHDRILNEAQNEAEELIEKVKDNQRLLIEENEITRQAKEYADKILREAEKMANDMKRAAYEYSDDILSSLQEKVREVDEIIDENRQALKTV